MDARSLITPKFSRKGVTYMSHHRKQMIINGLDRLPGFDADFWSQSCRTVAHSLIVQLVLNQQVEGKWLWLPACNKECRGNTNVSQEQSRHIRPGCHCSCCWIGPYIHQPEACLHHGRVSGMGFLTAALPETSGAKKT